MPESTVDASTPGLNEINTREVPSTESSENGPENKLSEAVIALKILEQSGVKSPEEIVSLQSELEAKNNAQVVALENKLNTVGVPPLAEPSLEMIHHNNVDGALGLETRKSARYSELTKLLGGDLKPTNFDARNVAIKELAERPDILVRERTLSEGEDADSVLASFQEAQGLFAQMQERYGIKVVAMESQLGKNAEGKPTIYTVVDKINRENLYDAKNLPSEATTELDQLYTALGRYYDDAWTNSNKFWADSKSSQFVYGNKAGEADKHIYVVDVDPTFYQPGEDDAYTIPWAVNSACSDLIENEHKLDTKTTLVGARATLGELVNKMLSVEPDSKPLLQAKELLEQT